MARARKVVADMNSLEVDELRREFNALVLVLENLASEVDAGNITADEAFTALYTTLSTGTDSDITGVDSGGNDYSGTGLTVAGVKPEPQHPRQARGSLTSMTKTSVFVVK